MDFTLNQTWPIFYNYMLVYKIWIQFTNLFKCYGMETIFQSWKRASTLKIIDGLYTKSNLTYILWLYTCVQNFNPIHQSFQKISHGNQKCYVWDGRDVRTYGQRWYYMHPHWKWRGHNKIKTVVHWKFYQNAKHKWYDTIYMYFIALLSQNVYISINMFNLSAYWI